MIELLIEDFSEKFDGIAYHNNTKVEVPHTLIGDKVEVKLYRKRKGKYTAKLLNIISPSNLRVNPICSHADLCGGCSLQQMSYKEQTEYKQKVIIDLFQKFILSGSEFFPIAHLKNDLIFHYRNKMEFSFSQNMKKDSFLGLMMGKRSRFVFNVDICFLAPLWYSEILKRVRNWWLNTNIPAFNLMKNEGALRYLTIRDTKKTNMKMVILAINKNSLSQEQINDFVKLIKDFDENISIYLREISVQRKSPTQITDIHLSGPQTLLEQLSIKNSSQNIDLEFEISPASFFQPNVFTAELLYQKTIELAHVKKDDVVFDLYCGTGTIGMAFAKIVKKVIGIELSKDAVLDGQKNIKKNNITNFDLIEGDVGEKLANINITPDLVIVDPPRSGLNKQAVDNLLKLRPKKILYISCNPFSQQKNILELTDIEKGPYKLKYLQPIDQFPHTYHIENISLLQLT